MEEKKEETQKLESKIIKYIVNVVFEVVIVFLGAWFALLLTNDSTKKTDNNAMLKQIQIAEAEITTQTEYNKGIYEAYKNNDTSKYPYIKNLYTVRLNLKNNVVVCKAICDTEQNRLLMPVSLYCKSLEAYDNADQFYNLIMEPSTNKNYIEDYIESYNMWSECIQELLKYEEEILKEEITEEEAINAYNESLENKLEARRTAIRERSNS